MVMVVMMILMAAPPEELRAAMSMTMIIGAVAGHGRYLLAPAAPVPR